MTILDIITVGFLLLLIPVGAKAQLITAEMSALSAEDYDAWAEYAFEKNDLSRAFQDWMTAAQLFERGDRKSRAIDAWESATRAASALQSIESILVGSGALMRLEEPDAFEELAELADQSPLFGAKAQSGEGNGYTAQVQRSLTAALAARDVDVDLTSASDATQALETFLSTSFTNMVIKADTTGMPVLFAPLGQQTFACPMEGSVYRHNGIRSTSCL